MMWTGVLLAFLAFAPKLAETLLSKGSILVPARKAVFLTKFCFDFDRNGRASGDWHLELTDASPKIGDMELLIFDDESYSYPDEDAMWDFQCGSQSLKKAAKIESPINISALPAGGKVAMPLQQRLRPRWWFVAVIDCSGIQRTVDYSLHMTNPLQGWQKEFSMDHCGLRSVVFIFSLYLALVFAQQRAVMQESESARHPLRLILLAAIAAACVGMLAIVLDGLWFARHGDSQASLHIVGKFFKVFSKGSLASILLLLSKGICISQPLHVEQMCHFGRLLTPFFGACLVLELWGEYSQSRTYTTGFIYCTWFGGALIMADLGFLVLYLKNLHCSYVAEFDVDRQRFYSCWGPMYALAFIVLPSATLLASVLSPWVRAEAIFLVTNGVHAAMLTMLVVGLWPEHAQKFFCIDNDKLAKTIGITTASLLETSPCSHDCQPKAVFSSGGGNPFVLPQESLP